MKKSDWVKLNFYYGYSNILKQFILVSCAWSHRKRIAFDTHYYSMN